MLAKWETAFENGDTGEKKKNLLKLQLGFE